MSQPAPQLPDTVMGVPQQVKVLDISLINQYRANAHVLVPTAKLVQPGGMFQLRLERVDISNDPEDRDVYQLPGTWKDPKYALSAKALQRIARASGIQHIRTEILTATSEYVLARARIKRRDESGEWIFGEGTYELDLKVIEEDEYATQVSKLESAAKNPRSKASEYAPKSDDECRKKAHSHAMKIRRHKVSRAETGAKCRAIRAMLGIENAYRLSDLALPFLVPSTVLNADHPDVKAVMANASRLTMAMFAPDEGAAIAAIEAETGKTRRQIQAEQMELIRMKHGPDEPTDDDWIAADVSQDAPIYDDEDLYP